MPYIPTRLRAFHNTPPGLPLGYPTGYPGVDVEITRDELLVHAQVVGSTEIFLRSPQRRASERIWRRLMLDSYLTEIDAPNGDRYFTTHESITRLDPSEAVAVSYFLGLTVCAAMADKLFRVIATVHSDKLAELLGLPREEGTRPDLVGIIEHDDIQDMVNYDDFQRGFTKGILLEAKSSLVGYRGAILARAKYQLENVAGDIASLVPRGSPKIASLAFLGTKNYRGARILRCDLLDPPSDESPTQLEVTTSAYNGLVLAAQLLPFVQIIRDAGEPYFPEDGKGRQWYYGARLPDAEATVLLPPTLFRVLSRIREPLYDKRMWNTVGEEVWDAYTEDREMPLDWIFPRPKRVVRLRSGMVFDGIRPLEEDEPREGEQ